MAERCRVVRRCRAETGEGSVQVGPSRPEEALGDRHRLAHGVCTATFG